MYLTWEAICQRRGGLELRVVGALGIELEGKLLERLELLHEELLLVRAHELARLLVEGPVERGQKDFRLVQNEQIQENTDLTQVVLRPPAAKSTSAADHRRFVNWPDLKNNFAVCFRV